MFSYFNACSFTFEIESNGRYYNFSSLMFFSLKLSDIAFKLILIEKVFIKKNLSQDLTLILLSPIDSFLPYMGMIIYPIFIYFALN